MTPSNNFEFWDNKLSDAEIARNVAEARLASIQRTGQLALFATQRPPTLSERRGEVIALPVEGISQ